MPAFYVICFDIRDETRLAKVSNTLENFGYRVQRSVFECYLDSQEITDLKHRLCRIADLSEDQIRYYQLCPKDKEKILIDGPGEVTRDEDFKVI